MNEKIIVAFNEFYGKREQLLNDVLVGLNPSDYFMLFTIDNYLEKNNIDSIYVSKIAELLNISVPAVSKSLKKLEEKKAIKRSIDLFSRRNTSVKITKNGKDLLKTNNERITNIVDKILEKVASDDIYKALGIKKEIENIVTDWSEGNAKVR